MCRLSLPAIFLLWTAVSIAEEPERLPIVQVETANRRLEFGFGLGLRSVFANNPNSPFFKETEAKAASPEDEFVAVEICPCYPYLSDPRGQIKADLLHFPRQFFRDSKSLISGQTFGTVGWGALWAAITANNWDVDVRRSTFRHARRWGGANNVLDVTGHPLTHLGGTAAAYASSLIWDSPETHRFSLAAVNALLITDASVLTLKYAFDTRRPNGESRGFPSGHVASTAALAVVIGEHFGQPAGLGAHAVTWMVAWHRIDDRKHDLSDVIFGYFLGLAIGEAVARNHRLEAQRIQLNPYFDPESGTVGLMLSKQY